MLSLLNTFLSHHSDFIYEGSIVISLLINSLLNLLTTVLTQNFRMLAFPLANSFTCSNSIIEVTVSTLRFFNKSKTKSMASLFLIKSVLRLKNNKFNSLENEGFMDVRYRHLLVSFFIKKECNYLL